MLVIINKRWCYALWYDKNFKRRSRLFSSTTCKKLDVTRSSVNAWEMGLSTPTTHYVVEIAKLFHVSTDYLLGLKNEKHIVLDGYSESEVELIYSLIKYFDEHK